MPTYVEIWVYKGVVRYKLNDAFIGNDLATHGTILKHEISQILKFDDQFDGGTVEIICYKRQLKPLKWYGVSAVYDYTDVNNPVTHTGFANNQELYDLFSDLALKI
jgi:glutathionyl-hydroquinone reductase